MQCESRRHSGADAAGTRRLLPGSSVGPAIDGPVDVEPAKKWIVHRWHPEAQKTTFTMQCHVFIYLVGLIMDLD